MVPGGRTDAGTPGRKVRGRPRDASIDDRVLTVVADLLEQVGPERLRTAEVAQQAHVGKATVYRRWPNRNALVGAALRRSFETGIPLGPPTGDLRTDLVSVTRTVLAYAGTVRGNRFLRVALAQAVTNPDLGTPLGDFIRQHRELYEDAWRQAAGLPEGHPTPINAALLVIIGTVTYPLVCGMPVPTPDEAEQIVDGIPFTRPAG